LPRQSKPNSNKYGQPAAGTAHHHRLNKALPQRPPNHLSSAI
jgi:hypothetical protein